MCHSRRDWDSCQYHMQVGLHPPGHIQQRQDELRNPRGNTVWEVAGRSHSGADEEIWRYDLQWTLYVCKELQTKVDRAKVAELPQQPILCYSGKETRWQSWPQASCRLLLPSGKGTSCRSVTRQCYNCNKFAKDCWASKTGSSGQDGDKRGKIENSYSDWQ